MESTRITITGPDGRTATGPIGPIMDGLSGFVAANPRTEPQPSPEARPRAESPQTPTTLPLPILGVGAWVDEPPRPADLGPDGSEDPDNEYIESGPPACTVPDFVVAGQGQPGPAPAENGAVPPPSRAAFQERLAALRQTRAGQSDQPNTSVIMPGVLRPWSSLLRPQTHVDTVMPHWRNRIRGVARRALMAVGIISGPKPQHVRTLTSLGDHREP